MNISSMRTPYAANAQASATPNRFHRPASDAGGAPGGFSAMAGDRKDLSAPADGSWTPGIKPNPFVAPEGGAPAAPPSNSSLSFLAQIGIAKA